MQKGLTEEYGPTSSKSSLYEYLPVYGLDPEDAGPSTQVALSRAAEERRHHHHRPVDGARRLGRPRSASTGIRAVVCPMMRQGVWFTQNGHTVDYAWDEKAGEKAFESSMKTIDEALPAS